MTASHQRASRTKISGMLADAAARSLGFTAEQRDAYFAAVEAAPPAIYRGGKMYPYPHHDDGMKAARAAGYAGPDQPTWAPRA
jgi:hypothetical protein